MSNIEIIREKIGALDTDTLIAMVRALVNDFREGTDLVFGEIICALEDRMDAADYIEICEELEGE